MTNAIGWLGLLGALGACRGPSPDDPGTTEATGPTGDTGPSDTGEPSDTGTPPVDRDWVDTLSGPAQKGPFPPGTEVVARELGTNGVPVGPPVSTTLGSDGRFVLTELPWQAPTWLEVSGTPYNELRGEPYLHDFTLNAAVLPVTGRGAAINVFTDLVAHRIAALLGEGQSFDAAQARAVDELAVRHGVTTPPEELDIFGGGVDAGADLDLLVYSAGLVARRLDLEEWTTVRADFADDGIINGDGYELHFEIVNYLDSNATVHFDQVAEGLILGGFDAPPTRDQADLGFFSNRCVIRSALTPGEVLCNDSDQLVTAVPGTPGHIDVWPDVPGLFRGSVLSACADGTYALGSAAGPLSDTFMTSFVPDRLTASGAPHPLTLTTGCDDPPTHVVGLTRLTDGTPDEPLALVLDDGWDGRVAAYPGATETVAYYVLQHAPPTTELKVRDFDDPYAYAAYEFVVRAYDHPDPAQRTVDLEFTGTRELDAALTFTGSRLVLEVEAAEPIVTALGYLPFRIEVE